MRAASKRLGTSLDDLRLALASVRDGENLGDLFERLCVGAARVTGARAALLLMQNGSSPEIMHAVGRPVRDPEVLLSRVHASGVFADRAVHGGEPMIVPLAWKLADASLAVTGGRPESLDALSLFGSVAGSLVDLRLLAIHAAAVAHRIRPAAEVPSVLASLGEGDALLVVSLDDLAVVQRRYGAEAVDALTAALGVHLLSGTRPPGDVLTLFHEGQVLVLLRDLKAPVEVVAHRLLDSWMSGTPTTSLSLGAAHHWVGSSPLNTLERAQAALASAMRIGAGRAHIAA